MSNKKFMVKCITALMLCLIGLASCRDKIPTNEIHYTTIDNSVLPKKDLFYFGAGRIVSNSYDPDKNVCILKLDKDVTEIGEGAFLRCSRLTSITIPPSVTKIGEGAFFDCSSLTSITIPESVTEIGEGAFYDCSSLTEVRIPKGCHVCKSAFKDCPNVQIIRY